jgi:hypothetical protein
MHTRTAMTVITVLLLILLLPGTALGKVVKSGLNSFIIKQEVILPDTPEAIYDATTGDISGWWDHHFSEKPLRFYIEAKPGGGFYEIFDESGDGVLHGTVTWAKRGKSLRFTGPLGLAGNAVTAVWTLTYEPHGEKGTKLTLDGRMSGALEEGWAEVVDSVWKHFLVDQLKPYVEQGKHRKSK